MEASVGKSHTKTASAYVNLGQAYHATGQLALAVEANRKALAVWLEVFGESDPRTITTLNNLALMCHQLGDMEKSQEYLQLSQKASTAKAEGANS